MPVKVVDASALAALLFGEPRAGEVALEIGQAGMAAPTLIRYEIGSVCAKKLALHPEKRDQLLRSLDLYDELDLKEIEIPVVQMVRTADSAGLSTYDAAYLWLSRNLKVSLVTLDQKLHEASIA